MPTIVYISVKISPSKTELLFWQVAVKSCFKVCLKMFSQIKLWICSLGVLLEQLWKCSCIHIKLFVRRWKDHELTTMKDHEILIVGDFNIHVDNKKKRCIGIGI